MERILLTTLLIFYLSGFSGGEIQFTKRTHLKHYFVMQNDSIKIGAAAMELKRLLNQLTFLSLVFINF